MKNSLHSLLQHAKPLHHVSVFHPKHSPLTKTVNLARKRCLSSVSSSPKKQRNPGPFIAVTTVSLALTAAAVYIYTSSPSTPTPKSPGKNDISTDLHLSSSTVVESMSKEELNDRYILSESEVTSSILGSGAFGSVFRGKERLTSNPVAIKIIPHSLMTPDSFFSEVSTLRRVQGHSNILTLKDVVSCEDSYYIISDLYDDGELPSLISHQGAFDSTSHDTISLIRSLISAVRHIHQSGIIHADLKPENIVFSENHAKIVDFGQAEALSNFTNKLGELRLDTLQHAIGTLVYTPPEVLTTLRYGRGKKYQEYDPRKIDVFSLGIIIYVLLYGIHPFDPEATGNQAVVLDNILGDKYFLTHPNKLNKSKKKLGSDVSKQAKDLLRHLLHPDPSKRYSTSQALSHPYLNPSNISVTESELLTTTFVRSLLLATLSSQTDVFKGGYDLLQENGEMSVGRVKRFHNETSEGYDLYPVEREDETTMLDFDSFERLLKESGCVRTLYRAKQTVYSEGDMPEGLFLLASGEAELKSDGKGYSTVLPGSVLGEIGLQAGGRRAISLHTKDACEIVFIPKALFYQAISSSQGLKHKLYGAIRLQQSRRLLDLLRHLLPNPEQAFIRRTYNKGEILYNTNDKSEYLYFILNGELGSFLEDAGQTAILARRGVGDFTGSTVYQKARHYCACIALTASECLLLPKDTVDELVSVHPVLLAYLASQSRWRKEVWNMNKVDMQRQLKEQQLDALGFQLGLHNTSSFQAYEKLLDSSPIKHYKRGQNIISTNQTPDTLFIIKSGSAIVEIQNPNNKKLKIAYLSLNDHYGDQELLQNKKGYNVTVECTTECDVICVPREQFNELLQAPDGGFMKILMTSQRNRKSRWGLSMLNMAKKVENVRTFKKKKGEVLYVKGDMANSMYYVHEGELRSRQEESKVASKGDTMCLMGAIGLSEEERRQHTMEVVSEEVVLSEIPDYVVKKLVNSDQFVSDMLELYTNHHDPEHQVENIIMARK